MDLPEDREDDLPSTALLSEPALAKDWERPEEDKAWSHLLDATQNPHQAVDVDRQVAREKA